MTKEAKELARLIIENEANKDELSEPNHHRQQAQAGLNLARLVVSSIDGMFGGCPYPNGPCTCTNGIGCVNVPVEEW